MRLLGATWQVALTDSAVAEPLETSLPSHLGGDSSRSDPLSTDPRRVIHVQERLAKLCTVTFVVVQRRPTRARPSQRPKPVRLKRLCWLHAADGSEPAHGLKIWVPTGRPERANSALDRPVVHLQTACSEQERVSVLARSVAFNPGQPFSPLPYRTLLHPGNASLRWRVCWQRPQGDTVDGLLRRYPDREAAQPTSSIGFWHKFDA